jgi:hypothetical protein
LFVYFFLLGPSSFELLSLRLLDALDVLLLALVLIFGVSVGCGVGEVALSAGAGEVSALGVFPFSTAFALFLHS